MNWMDYLFYEDVDNIDDDPLFVHPEEGDYRLLSGSPCINKGNAGAPELPADQLLRRDQPHVPVTGHLPRRRT